MKNIAIFASGNGTNAERIIRYFEKSEMAQINIVLTNKSDAGVIKRAHSLSVEVHVFNRNDFYDTNRVINILEKHNTDLIVLAGFLWLIPENILEKYENEIINIHPALLPAYGGKGMYGARVHEAVIASGDPKSGITIHKVNKCYDEGQIIFQAEVKIDSNETPDSLAGKIHLLEYEHFPKIIEGLLIK